MFLLHLSLWCNVWGPSLVGPSPEKAMYRLNSESTAAPCKALFSENILNQQHQPSLLLQNRHDGTGANASLHLFEVRFCVKAMMCKNDSLRVRRKCATYHPSNHSRNLSANSFSFCCFPSAWDLSKSTTLLGCFFVIFWQLWAGCWSVLPSRL